VATSVAVVVVVVAVAVAFSMVVVVVAVGSTELFGPAPPVTTAPTSNPC